MTLFTDATDAFGARLRAVTAEQWAAPTPDDDWDVRALVNHVAGEVLWLPPMLAGSTIAEVGDRFDGDVLGDGQLGTWNAAVAKAVRAASSVDPRAIVHLSYGDRTAAEYVHEVGADVLIHTWDLARAIGADEQLPPDRVNEVATWFAGVEDLWRGAGVIASRPAVADDAGAQTRLLAAFGRAV